MNQVRKGHAPKAVLTTSVMSIGIMAALVVCKITK